MGPEQAEAKAGRIVEHLFRQEAGKIIASLTGAFGLRYLELAEDALQEALLEALRRWSYGNLPPNPAAWLMQVAQNRALDVVRRDARFREKEKEIRAAMDPDSVLGGEGAFMADEIRDNQLRLIFACCHPALAPEAQVALTLKTLCGFGIGEIARAFLTTDDAIAKRLTRARSRLRSAGVPFEIPDGRQLSERLDGVLNVLYLVFNEGYNASHGSDMVRRDLCEEAIRLATLMTENAATDTPKTRALLALFFLQAARFPARLNAMGDLYLLEEQDRSRWDREMIATGLHHLERAAAGERLSAFHVEAGIAACHSAAATYPATDWARILSLYDLLLEMTASPVAALNRAVALAKVYGPAAGLEELVRIKDHHRLERYYLYCAVRAEFCSELGRQHEAAADYRRALGLTKLEAEQRLLRRRVERIQ
jgi:RNA polymerase sigma-70 factor (ECF subfamily)